MKYTPVYFYKSMPKWKRKKDPILSRIFYRPISFLFSSIFAGVGISANAVSYFSIIVALASAVLFFLNNNICSLVGAALVNLWLILDCTDGNIARSVKKQPYGEYADSVSSYFLVPLLCISIGYYNYNNGGILFEEKNNMPLLLIAIFAGLSDTMMRLIYHKYKEVTNHMIEVGVVKEMTDDRNDHSKVNSIRVRIESDFGIGGIIPLITLFAIIFGFSDILIIYFAMYYIGSFIVVFFIYTIKAMKYGKQSFIDENDKDKE